MKLLVFAHTPPPHHGQSYMVQLLLNGLGGDRRRGTATQPSPLGIDCYHVNARVSKQLEDIGDFRPTKLMLLLWYCLEAIYVRFRYGVENLYYVPAPGKKSALYRDWLVMFLCRPFFKRTILHWHATSLSGWLETFSAMPTRRITYRLLGEVDLSIVLSPCNRFIAEKLLPRRVEVVANGIPDPCPEFETSVLPRRLARIAARKRLLAGEDLTERDLEATGPEPHVIRVLFLAHCTREKGLFDAVEGALRASAQLRARQAPVELRLIVAGSFQNPQERADFDHLHRSAPHPDVIHYQGFVRETQKEQALLNADLLCFPSHWDNQPVTVIEALAFGLPPVISCLPSVQEMLPVGYAGVVSPKKPDQMAAALLSLASFDEFLTLRKHFEVRFSQASYSANLAAAFRRGRAEASLPS